MNENGLGSLVLVDIGYKRGLSKFVLGVGVLGYLGWV